MKPSDFAYSLPPESIAQFPLPRRRDARLLHLTPSGPPVHRSVADFPSLLPAGDVLVVNETRVIPARLELRRASGGVVELFALEEKEGGTWSALAKPLRRLRDGEVLTGGGGAFRARILARVADVVSVAFEDEAGAKAPAAAILERWGRVPLPPYIRRGAAPQDEVRYQTVFARVPGAVAAPTAGLHFDEELLREIRERGVTVASIVLHVGPGTFRPLPDDDPPLDTIRLDAERYEIPAAAVDALARARAAGGRVVACGTTVARALETFVRNGEAAGSTTLFIHPPFEFRAVGALLTNFHLPRSSLLCLAAAFSGRERILEAYALAVASGYRFYSYGDATFLEAPA